MITIANPLNECKKLADQMKHKMKIAERDLGDTRRRMEILKKMKHDRKKDMIKHKHPFILYTALLP